MTAKTYLARAKVNLCLHIVGRRASGYHLLESLVAFPKIGDVMVVAPSSVGVSLHVDGPFACALSADADNLVLRAAKAIWRPGLNAALRLEKNLPIASGIGGGSSDAATALRALGELWAIDGEALQHVAPRLGADVAVCLAAPTPQWMTGIGADLRPAPALPDGWIVLVNPGCALATSSVFDALLKRNNAGFDVPKQFKNFADLIAWLQTMRNDLTAAAVGLAPEIRGVLDALGAHESCALARMSGSGATCFGLFEAKSAAKRVESVIRAAHPAWWITAAPLM